jgi:acyl-CoA thioesterase
LERVLAPFLWTDARSFFQDRLFEVAMTLEVASRVPTCAPGPEGAATGMSAFDEATALTPIAPGRWSARLSERFNIGPVPNGGYVMSIALAAAVERFAGRDPLTLTTHFLRPAEPGDAELELEELKEGKRYASAMVRLTQRGKERARTLVTLGTLDAGGDTRRLVRGAPPELPPLEETVPVPGTPFFRLGEQFHFHLDAASASWTKKELQPHAEIRGYARFSDGREPDLRSLPLFADALFPAVFTAMPLFAPVPTLEMTTHLRAVPAPGWLRCVFRSRFVFGGLVEEDGEIWDSRGELVALSRQLAQLPAA